MKSERMLETIKKLRLSQLKRLLSFYQAFLISFLVALILTFFDFFKAILNGESWIVHPFFIIILMLFVYVLGLYSSNTSLLVEFKEEGVHKWSRKKALEYIREEKEGI